MSGNGTTTERPKVLNAYQLHVLGRIDELSDQVSEVRVDIGKLQGRARAWGAVPGVAAVIIALLALFK